jgi:hypothetical protein
MVCHYGVIIVSMVSLCQYGVSLLCQYGVSLCQYGVSLLCQYGVSLCQYGVIIVSMVCHYVSMVSLLSVWCVIMVSLLCQYGVSLLCQYGVSLLCQYGVSCMCLIFCSVSVQCFTQSFRSSDEGMQFHNPCHRLAHFKQMS